MNISLVHVRPWRLIMTHLTLNGSEGHQMLILHFWITFMMGSLFGQTGITPPYQHFSSELTSFAANLLIEEANREREFTERIADVGSNSHIKFIFSANRNSALVDEAFLIFPLRWFLGQFLTFKIVWNRWSWQHKKNSSIILFIEHKLNNSINSFDVNFTHFEVS